MYSVHTLNTCRLHAVHSHVILQEPLLHNNYTAIYGFFPPLDDREDRLLRSDWPISFLAVVQYSNY